VIRKSDVSIDSEWDCACVCVYVGVRARERYATVTCQSIRNGTVRACVCVSARARASDTQESNDKSLFGLSLTRRITVIHKIDVSHDLEWDCMCVCECVWARARVTRKS